MTLSEFKQSRLFKIIKNKYLIAVEVFVLVVLFTPRNSFLYYLKVNKQLKELEDRKQFLEDEIHSDSIRFSELEKSMEAAEKFGREKYMMKRENEDIYVIKEKDKPLK